MAFQAIAKMWLTQEFPKLSVEDNMYKMVLTFAAFLDMSANRAEDLQKKGKNVKN